MRRLLPMLIALGLMGPPVGAVSFYFTPDVPTNDPSGATPTIFLPWDVVRCDSASTDYSHVQVPNAVTWHQDHTFTCFAYPTYEPHHCEQIAEALLKVIGAYSK